MLTADTLLNTVTQTLHPIFNPHTPTPSLLHSIAQADVYFPQFPLLSLSILTSSCLWSIIPALHPSLLLSPPPLCITLQCYAALLSQHTACRQLADGGRKGKHTLDSRASTIPHVHAGRKKGVTKQTNVDRNEQDLPSHLLVSLCLCPF